MTIINVQGPVIDAILYASVVVAIAAALSIGIGLTMFAVGRLRETKEKVSPSVRWQMSVSRLARASEEMNRAMRDVVAEIKAGEDTLEGLQERHSALSEEVAKLTARTETLRHTPIDVAKYIQELNEQADKKSRKRDIRIMIAGIILAEVVHNILGLSWDALLKLVGLR